MSFISDSLYSVFKERYAILTSRAKTEKCGAASSLAGDNISTFSYGDQPFNEESEGFRVCGESVRIVVPAATWPPTSSPMQYCRPPKA